MFGWLKKNQTDAEALAMIERIALAAERQAEAVELSAITARAANNAAAKKYAAEQLLIEEEIERRRL